MDVAHCTVALEHGVYGPFVEADSWYTRSTGNGLVRRLTDRVLAWVCARVDSAMPRCISLYQSILPLAGPAISKGFAACIGEGHAGDPRIDPTKDSSIIRAGVDIDRVLAFAGFLAAIAWEVLFLISATCAAACVCWWRRSATSAAKKHD